MSNDSAKTNLEEGIQRLRQLERQVTPSVLVIRDIREQLEYTLAIMDREELVKEAAERSAS